MVKSSAICAQVNLLIMTSPKKVRVPLRQQTSAAAPILQTAYAVFCSAFEFFCFASQQHSWPDA
jgi:hypothetical protein